MQPIDVKVDKSGRTSAGIVLWRRRAGALEVLSFVPGQDFEVVTVSIDPLETPKSAD